MRKVEIVYNPFLKEVDIKVDGEKAGEQLLNIFKDIKLGDSWAIEFLKTLDNFYRDSEYDIDFMGLVRDYEFLEDAKNYFKGDCQFYLKGVENCIYAHNQLEELKEVFDWMCETYPFDDKSIVESFKKQFKAATNNEFEIAVVATMSSGKSTLINALLGRELLPARNEATTATIAKIYDKYEEDRGIEGFENFSAVVKNADGEVLEKFANFSPQDMDRINTAGNSKDGEDKQKSRKIRPSTIEIEGHIPGIPSSRNMRLVLSDTPGPNNSQTSEHQEHTYKLLEDEYKPMILYVLNATQFATNDDKTLLRYVADAMKQGGRQAQERFLFVLNKADAFDPQKGENIENIITKVKEYLKSNGIDNPSIFPLSAQMAKVIRQYLNKDDALTETEEDEILPKYETFNKREYKHFEKYASLSCHCEEQQEQLLKNEQHNPYQEALIHTGIVSIELAITEYIQKYALPTKVSEGVASFKEKLDNLNLESEEKSKLENNEAEIKKYSQNIAKIQKALANGEKAKEIENKIKALSSKEKTSNILDELSNDFFENIDDELNGFSGEQLKEIVEAKLSTLKYCINNASSKLKVDLEHFLENHIKDQAESYVVDYRNYVKALFDNGLELEFSLDTSAAVLGDLVEISSTEILNNYKYETREVVDSYEVSTSKWWNPFSWGSTETRYEYGDIEKVDCDKVKEKEILPMLQNFVDSNREAALQEIQRQEEAFKKFFLQEFDKLNHKIRDKMNEQQDMLSNKEKLEASLEKNRANLAWLNEVHDRLEQVLSIKKS